MGERQDPLYRRLPALARGPHDGRVGLSRRAFIAGGVVAAGAVGAGLVVRGVPSDPEPAPGGTPTGFTPVPTGDTSSPAAAATVTPVPRGGVFRRTSPASFSFDTFDALKTGEPSVAEVVARTHSRIVRWSQLPAGSEIGDISGDLCQRWEQPDSGQILLQIDPRATWRDDLGNPSRAVTAEDIAHHLRRRMAVGRSEGQPLVQRGWTTATFETVDVIDPGTVRLRLARPDAFVLDTLAARFALVQQPETVTRLEGKWRADIESAQGSGPWRLVEAGEHLAFTAASGGHLSPHLDRLEVFQPVARPGAADLASRDEWVVRDPRDTSLFDSARWTRAAAFEDSPIISTFYVGASPWRDRRLIRAMQLALNRQWLVDALFGGRAAASGIIPPVFAGWAPAGTDLATVPGFGDPASDAKDAKQLWDAARGSQLQPVTIDFPTVFDPRYSASSIITDRLSRVLGGSFRAAVDSYPNIARKAAERYYGNGRSATWFGWGAPFAEPDPGLWLAETYASGSATAIANGYGSETVDRAIERVRTSPRPERRSLYFELAKALSDDASGGVVTWAVETHDRFQTSNFHDANYSVFALAEGDKTTWQG